MLYTSLGVVLVLTCHSRKSLSLTSPDVLIRRSQGGESPVYRHFSNSSSVTSLWEGHEWEHKGCACAVSGCGCGVWWLMEKWLNYIKSRVF